MSITHSAISSDRVDTVLGELGLTGPFAQETYVKNMERQYGRKADRYMDAVDSAHSAEFSPARWGNLYQLKNSDWRMSAYSSAHAYSPLYRAFLLWIAEHLDTQPARIVDLGCENGLLTLAMAKLMPNATLLGIERVPNALAAARRRQTRHAVKNATFLRADLSKPFDQVPPKSDLIIAAWVLHEILGTVRDGSDLGKGKGQFLQNLAEIAEPGTVLVSVNRFEYPEKEIPVLTEQLTFCGFCHIGESSIAASEGDMISQFPIVCYEKTA